MDRKYRQRGYMDSNGDRAGKKHDQKARSKPESFGPRTPKMPGTHSVVRCAGCGAILPADFDAGGQCPRCKFELHSCAQCAYFDTSARFECTQPITTRVPRKNIKNDCSFYSPRVTVERQTSPSFKSRTDDPRKAFEDLFKK
jgi:hypothetical protein